MTPQILRVLIDADTPDAVDDFPCGEDQYIICIVDTAEGETLANIDLGHSHNPTVSQKSYLESNPAVNKYWVDE